MHCLIVFSFIQVFDESKKCDNLLTWYVEIQNDNPLKSHLQMELTLTEEY
jgi:hypothetical protein